MCGSIKDSSPIPNMPFIRLMHRDPKWISFKKKKTQKLIWSPNHQKSRSCLKPPIIRQSDDCWRCHRELLRHGFQSGSQKNPNLLQAAFHKTNRWWHFGHFPKSPTKQRISVDYCNLSETILIANRIFFTHKQSSSQALGERESKKGPQKAT